MICMFRLSQNLTSASFLAAGRTEPTSRAIVFKISSVYSLSLRLIRARGLAASAPAYIVGSIVVEPSLFLTALLEALRHAAGDGAKLFWGFWRYAEPASHFFNPFHDAFSMVLFMPKVIASASFQMSQSPSFLCLLAMAYASFTVKKHTYSLFCMAKFLWL